MGIRMRAEEYDDYMDNFGRRSPQEEAEEELIYSAMAGNIPGAQRALGRGADVHVEDDRSLVEAARNGQYEMVRFLIENGANVHAQVNNAIKWASEAPTSTFDPTNFYDEVHLSRYVRTVQVLLENGAEWGDVEVVSVSDRYWPDRPATVHVDNRVTKFLKEVLGVDELPDSREELINMIRVHLIHEE